MITQTIVCDGCGVVKKQTNHWYRLAQGKKGLTLTESSGDYLTPKDYETGSSGVSLHDLCGSACVIKKVSEFLSKGQ